MGQFPTPNFCDRVLWFQNSWLEPICEATASWKWFNWWLALLPRSKQPLLLNMDETACRLFYDPAKGVLATELVALAARRGSVASSVAAAQTRSVLSLVALLCNDSSIQPHLPQYILGNEHVLQSNVLGELRRDRSLSPNVHIVRRKKCMDQRHRACGHRPTLGQSVAAALPI